MIASMSPESSVCSSRARTSLNGVCASSAWNERLDVLHAARLDADVHGKGTVLLAARLHGGDAHVGRQRLLEL
jgi:hypothetical protein